MNITARFMVITAAAVMLPLLLSAGTQGVQGAQQNISLEGRIAQLQQRVQEDPRNPDLHFELSQLYEENVDKYYDESLSEFGLAIDKGLKGRSILSDVYGRPGGNMNTIGKKLLNQGQYDEAILAFESAYALSKLSGGDARPIHNIGTVYHVQGKLDKALESYKEALILDKTEKEVYKSIGGLYLSKDDPKLALLYFNKGKCIDPDYPLFDFGIGKALMLSEQYDEAIQAFDRGLYLYSQKRRLEKEEKELVKKVEMYRKQCVQMQK